MNAPIKFLGKPTGPEKFIPELGYKVATFEEKPGGKFPALKHHVPLYSRGMFRPEQLANFDEEKEYRVDKLGWLLCYGKTITGSKCKRRAVNRYPRCNYHGGRLHPLDKLEPNDVNIEDNENNEEEKVTRYKQFLAGQITVEDLDDEEIMCFGFRTASGRIMRPKQVPREMVTAFTRTLYDRSLQELKVNTLEAAKTLASIMIDSSNDASIRLKAAEAILDRTLGKAPQVVSITSTAPWEEIFDEIATITRSESRSRREANTIDAVVVDGNGQMGQIEG